MMSLEGISMEKLVLSALVLGFGNILVKGGEKYHVYNHFVFLNPNEAMPWTELDFNRAPPPAAQPFYSRVEKRCFGDRKVFFKGLCWSLLTRGPCKDGEWLALDPTIAGIKPICQPKLCPSDKTYWEPTGECISLNDQTKCTKKDTSLQVDTLGYGACKCMPGIARAMAPNGACYRLYTRGFCDEGYVVVNNHESDDYKPTCIPDACASSYNSTTTNEIYLPYKGSCYLDGSHEPCPQDEGLSVDVHTGVPTCSKDLTSWHVVSLPPYCPLVDHGNNCRDKITIDRESANFIGKLNLDKSNHKKNFNKG